MKARNSAPPESREYRTSWEYWGAIHGYPGPSSPSGTLADVQNNLINRFPDDAPLYAGFFNGRTDLTPPAQSAGVADQTWATCQHATAHFLSWHRMYLYFFERVLREASGNPDFALPYWDYTNDTVDPADPGNPPWQIPTIFAVDTLGTTTGPIPNPLFERRRTAGFGSSVHLAPTQTNIDSVLAIEDFFQFQSNLDRGLHGFIHCAVGNGCLAPYIGLVPFSGNDPIFWHHHANVDRLWDCWTKTHGEAANPTTDTAWMSQEFSFVDEDGNLATMEVSELFDPDGRIDYVYDNSDNCFRIQPPEEEFVLARDVALAAGPERTAESVEMASAANVQVNRIEQEIPLVATSERSMDAVLFAARPSVIRPTKAMLRLEGVQIDKEPGVSVSVYLLDEAGGKRAFVGLFGCFAAFDHATHGAADRGRDYAFDVTRQLQELFGAGSVGDGVGVALVASRGLVGGDANTLTEERYQAAGLAIGKIALEIESTEELLDLQ